ncbi:MAG: SDR family oxidoreductase [Halieaceae bacterium]|nr:SDR family oxidoreductase [Halieaceae bacterium]
MTSFNDKVILVTGSGSGIGRATALHFARLGARVFAADINTQGLAETLASLDPAKADSTTLDVSDAEQCQAAVDQCLARFDRLDVLCNIAGIPLCEHVTAITDAQWQQQLDVNLSGVFYMTRAALPALEASGGNLINMSSSAGLVGQAYNAAYCATKAGVLMFTKAVAIEYSQRGVRANAVCPGMVKTPLALNFTMPEGADLNLLARLNPLLEGAEPEEVAAAIAYLASDEARFVTGAALPIDGAQTAG